jgi:hypothetical protein
MTFWSCSAKYAWKSPDGSNASSKDIAECHSESNKGNKSRQLAAPVEVSANGTILPSSRSVAQNNFRSSQIYQNCMAERGYVQTEIEAQ